MPVFIYKAKSLNGDIIDGQMEAIDENAVIMNLRSKNYLPLNIKKYNGTYKVRLYFFKKVSLRDIAIFCKQFYSIISSGITVIDGLNIIIENTENKNLKKALISVTKSIYTGKSISEAMSREKVFPNILINMIKIGETSGKIDKIMYKMSEYYDKEYRISQKIKQALTYPLIVCGVAFIVSIILVDKVLPVFINILSQFEKSSLPLPTRIVISLSNNMKNQNSAFIFFIIILFLCFLKFLIKSRFMKNIIDIVKIKMVLFGNIYVKVISARFARTVSVLVSSGISIIDALEFFSLTIDNIHLKKYLKETKNQLEKGKSLGDALKTRGIFPPMLIQMIKIGEETGSLDIVLQNVSNFYEEESENSIVKLITLIEPLTIITVSIIVGTIVASIILPLFKIYEYI